MSGTSATKRRRVILATLLALVILIGYFAVRVAVFLSGKPTISVNYAVEYNERLRPTDLDPNDNAGPIYKDAFARLPDVPDDIRSISGRLTKYDPCSIEWKLAESWVASSEEAMKLLQQAIQKPGFWVDLTTINFNDPALLERTDFTKFRDAMFSLRCRAWYLATKGDIRGAWDCVIATCRMSQHMGTRGRMQINLGQAMQGLAHATAFNLLSQTDMDSGLLAQLQTQFEEILAARTTPGFEGDEILLRDAIQRYFTDNGKGDGHVVPRLLYDQYRKIKPPKNELDANAAYLKHLGIAWFHPTRVQTVQTLERLTRRAGELVPLPPGEMRAKGTSHKEELEKLAKGNYFLHSLIVVQTLAQTSELFHRAGVSGEALVATMGLLRFHKDKGTWPASMEELAAAGYIQRVPIDPYSGKPLVYRQLDESFTLYSLGQDFDDDGGTGYRWGQPPDGGDQVF